MKSYVFPGNIHGDILKIGAEQIPYMRTQEFSELNKDSERLLLEMVNCSKGRTIIYTASGTGAMDAVVANYVRTKKKAFVIDGGSFGHRWYELCRYYACECYRFVVPFAKDIDYQELEKKVAEECPDVFLCQHHETSSGQLFNLSEISRICQKYNVSLVVDVISSFLAEDFDMDALHVDICLTSTQKGLNLPPGLSIIFLSSRLNGYKFAHHGYYFDFEDNLNNLKRGQTPFSPATSIYLQLNKRLHQIQEYGLENVVRDVRENAVYFRSLCQQYGWEIPAENPSYAITGFYVNKNADRMFRTLIEKYDIYIMPGSKEGFFRVSHMGIQSKYDLNELAMFIHQIENE